MEELESADVFKEMGQIYNPRDYKVRERIPQVL